MEKPTRWLLHCLATCCAAPVLCQRLRPPVRSASVWVSVACLQAESLLCGAGSPSALLNAMPMLLDPDVLQEVLQQVERLFGGSCQPLQLLQHNPSLALSCVSLKGQSRGERDVEYLGGIFAAGGQQEQ